MKGAIKSIISKKIKQFSKNKIIKVKSTFSSLNSLAKVTRENSYAKIIGITGSVGKTTLKNLISFALNNYGKVYHSPYSYNNKFGVPLSLSNLKRNTEYGIFEIGMDKKGEINSLSKIVKPEIAIITNISGAHFKNFNTLKDIAKAKAEIINNISKGGNIILNADGEFFNFLSKKAKKNGINVISFGIKKKSDVFLSHIKKFKNYYRLKIIVKNKIFYFDTKYFVNNFINNILDCVSTMYVLNLNLEKMKRKFINFKIPDGRGDINKIKKFNKKFTLIDESYNSNPLSLEFALNNFSKMRSKSKRKIILLGDMLELGKFSKKLHLEAAEIVNNTGINRVYVYGKKIVYTFNKIRPQKRGKILYSSKDVSNFLNNDIKDGEYLMIKGSNTTGLNTVTKMLKSGKINVI